MAKKPFFITTPIYYPSGNPHIGHCYTTVACDAIARYRRMQGYDVLFLTGTDEHGLKIEQKARTAGMEPQAYVDGMTECFRNLWNVLNVRYDRFVRTTDDYHVRTVQVVFQKLYDRGYIYKGQYVGKYCTPCESFWTPKQLVDGKCPDCGREVTDAREEAYFFKLSAFTDTIGKLLEGGTFLQPNSRAKELIGNFIKPGLEDVCVSRTGVTWGVPVPFEPKHTVYVWFDALLNYISALGYENGAFEDFQHFWPADVHFVAKDIMRFHAILWPAVLTALGLPLPKRLAVHGWITVGGEKMSKSRGNVIDPYVLTERYGTDAVRYFLLREMILENDSAFSEDILAKRVNADLANGIGNLVARTVAMVEKYFGGTLSAERKTEPIDEPLIKSALALRDKTDVAVDAFRLNEALAAIIEVISLSDKYIDETAPWVLAKDPTRRARLATVLCNLLETLRITSGLLVPFMPTMMPKVWDQIGATEEDVVYDKLNQWGILKSQATVHKGEILFPKREAKEQL